MTNDDVQFITTNDDVTTIAELSDAELDMVAAGSLVNINIPVSVAIGVGIQNALNIAVLSSARQRISQALSLNVFSHT